MNFAKNDLINYTLHLADDPLILGHRNSEWCGHGPVLEQDIALTNIALDLIGQSRNFYQYAASLINSSTGAEGKPRGELITEDSLAYLRDAREFRNCLLVEQPNGDWAKTILRQFLFSAYQFYFYEQLKTAQGDRQLAAIAEKSFTEVTYHLRWSSEWVIRLGDGTRESHARLMNAVDDLWMYSGELLEPAAYENGTIDFGLLKSNWEQRIRDIFSDATLPVPDKTFMQNGGKEGTHTEHLGHILAELQFMQRAYPGCEW